ncbi:unnamed protein product [Oreochromis niloticus]|nr:unnamed protein product [Mustela putorius furo]
MFSAIDLENAYYQLPLHEDSRDLTAFITHDGLFRFCRVPYGLASAPSAFQKMMAEILKDLPGVQNYLDDLIVYSKSAAEHDQNLSTVLQKLKDAGLVLNENKCHFRKTSLRFLGHVVTADGILPDEEHIDAVLRAPPPSDAVALRSFLGLVSWYSKFLPNFATVVAPMLARANDKNTFTWTSDAQASFEEVKKTPGSQNYTADCLSRLPLPVSSHPTSDADHEMVAQVSAAMSSLPVANFDSACSTCPELVALRSQIQSDWPASIKTLDVTLAPYYKIRNELSTLSDYVLRGSRLIAPLSVRPKLIALAHESHQGIVRTKQRLRDLYWWPKMDSQVPSAITSCLLCQSNDKTTHTNPAALQPIPLPDGLWKKLGLDIVGPFDTAIPACRYVITLTDYYSKCPELAFSPSATTDDVIQFLSSVFSHHGNPENIVIDNGTQFTSVMFTSFLQSRGISHSRTSVYYPAANGAIERFHRALRTCIQTAIQQSKPWKATVLDWLQVYRATPHATTSLSPYELLYGRKMYIKLDVLPLPPAVSPLDDVARHSVQKYQLKMQRYADESHQCNQTSPHLHLRDILAGAIRALVFILPRWVIR